MNALYIETSAILCWLFGEPGSEKVIRAIENHDIILSSVISIIETERALIRAKTSGLITEADRQLLKGEFMKVNAAWNFLEITGAVRKRACMVFPVEPVRSLDAIHLATALEFLLVYPDLSILTCDRRIIKNMVPLGLKGA